MGKRIEYLGVGEFSKGLSREVSDVDDRPEKLVCKPVPLKKPAPLPITLESQASSPVIIPVTPSFEVEENVHSQIRKFYERLGGKAAYEAKRDKQLGRTG